MASTRKPIFNKPAWASRSVAENPIGDRDNDASIFSQSHIYEDILAEERKRRERQTQRTQNRKERSNVVSKKHADTRSQGEDDGVLEARNGKRRRLSKEDQTASDLGYSSDDKDYYKERQTDHSSGETPIPDLNRPVLRSTTQKNTRLSDRVGSKSPSKSHSEVKTFTGTTVISLDSDDSDSENMVPMAARNNRHTHRVNKAATVRASKPVRKSSDSESEEDEYLRELRRKAREDARLKRLGPDQRENSSDRPKHGDSGAIQPPVVGNIASPVSETQPDVARDTSTPVPDDPLVQILIRTMIPGANPLIVQRRASQPLDKVKQYWCERNSLHPTIVSKVFFTWNGTRLYNSTTMRGIMELLKKTHPTLDGRDPSDGKIEIEAMTDEIFEYRRMQQERRRREAAGIRDESPEVQQDDKDKVDESQTADDVNAEKPQRSGPVIRLTCPEIEELTMRVRPQSTVAKIIMAFRRKRDVDPGKDCWLSYDGDRLNDDQTVDEVGFEDEDTVEVYLR